MVLHQSQKICLIFADRWVSSFSSSQQGCCRDLMLALPFSSKHHEPRELLCPLTPAHPMAGAPAASGMLLERNLPPKDPKEALCSRSSFSLTVGGCPQPPLGFQAEPWPLCSVLRLFLSLCITHLWTNLSRGQQDSWEMFPTSPNIPVFLFGYV